ncbi:MAG TPA: hypothetical protein VH247_12655 [Thermoleophilaceae bacterium]|nr:hypothetical protein [Thermoleophilaceae bacterium]
MSEAARWWTVRRAHNRKPATYTCPFCRKRLHAMSEHALIAPEGDMERRRHAHVECVASARLPSYEDWRRTQPREPGFLARLLHRGQ